jgi:very-short-patch-repair endonuclease
MEENQLEKDFRKEIEHQGYVVETQKQFGYYPVDCYLPEIDVILQVDGTYWHAKPGLYEEDELDDLQKRHRVCDARFASYCENKGLKYARVWQDDFYANPEKEIKEAIKKALRREP